MPMKLINRSVSWVFFAAGWADHGEDVYLSERMVYNRSRT